MVRDVLAEFIIGPAFGRTRWLALLTMRVAVVSQVLEMRAEIVSQALSLTLANFNGVHRALVTRNIGSFSTIS